MGLQCNKWSSRVNNHLSLGISKLIIESSKIGTESQQLGQAGSAGIDAEQRKNHLLKSTEVHWLAKPHM